MSTGWVRALSLPWGMSGINIFQVSSAPQSPSLHQNQLHSHQIRAQMACGCQISATASPYKWESWLKMGTEHGFGLEISGIWQAHGSALETSPLPPQCPSLFSHFLLVTLPGLSSPQGWGFTPRTLWKPSWAVRVSGTSLHWAVSSSCVSCPTLLSLWAFAAPSGCSLGLLHTSKFKLLPHKVSWIQNCAL